MNCQQQIVMNAMRLRRPALLAFNFAFARWSAPREPPARDPSRRSAVPRHFPASRRLHYVQTGLRCAYSVALSSQ
jgi:hypothetical protein